MHRFRLTLAFLVISAGTLAVAAVFILRVSSSVEERNVVGMTTTQAAKDAELIARTVSRMLSAEDAGVTVGDAGPADTGSTTVADTPAATTVASQAAAAAVSEFLDTSNIVRLALYELTGMSVWSTDALATPIREEQVELFESAAGGETASGLLKGYRPGAGVTSPSVDVVETYIPLVGETSGEPVRVLAVTRDVTATLATRIGQTRGAMFRVTLLSLGGGFLLLLAFIVIADRAIWLSKQRALRQEQALAEQRIGAARLDAENRELQRLNDERSRLVALISHELKTPLTSMLAFTDVLIDGQGDNTAEENRKHLRAIQRSGDHLNEMIGDLLDMSRLDSGDYPLNPSEFTIGELLSEVSQAIDPILRGQGQTLQTFGDVDHHRLMVDRTRIRQVLMNLLSNASKYSSQGTPIELTATVENGALHVRVRDHGIGIPWADQRRVFAKFFRVDTEATRAVSGTGLGLPIAKAIVERHGGEIKLSSTPGVGTIVEFSIPTGRPSPAAPRAAVREISAHLSWTSATLERR